MRVFSKVIGSVVGSIIAIWIVCILIGLIFHILKFAIIAGLVIYGIKSISKLTGKNSEKIYKDRNRY